jgi:hypothetical protein
LGLLYFAVGGALLGAPLLWPRTRRRALVVLTAGARRLTALERRRRSFFFGDRFPDRPVPDRRILRHLAARTYSGLLTGVVVGLLGFGAVLAGLLVVGLARGTLDWGELVSQVLLGGVLLFLNVQGLFSLVALDARLARECFGPSERELMQQRIDELATSRAAVLRAVDTERRRIERDLHDGVQQRLVALAMLLGRARRGRGRRAPCWTRPTRSRGTSWPNCGKWPGGSIRRHWTPWDSRRRWPACPSGAAFPYGRSSRSPSRCRRPWRPPRTSSCRSR